MSATEPVPYAVPPDEPWPDGAVVWCVMCGRFVKTGTPYRLIEPGRFAHRGPCRVIPGGGGLS